MKNKKLLACLSAMMMLVALMPAAMAATTEVATLDELKTALAAGGSIKLTADIVTDEQLVVAKNTTLDMNGKTLSNTQNIYNDANGNTSWSLLSVQGGHLTITGNGNFQAKDGDCYCVDVRNGASCTIMNGSFNGNISAVYVHKGSVAIYGGTFEIQQLAQGGTYELVINRYDGNTDSSSIAIYGGKFEGFDPANPGMGEKASFLPAGATAVKDGTDWVVTYTAPVAPSSHNNPKTGDNTPIAMLAVLLAASALGLTFMRKKAFR